MRVSSIEDTLVAFEGVKSIAVCGHVHPDGDCLGSVMALTLALRSLGIDTTPLLGEEASVPTNLAMLPHVDDFVPAANFTQDVELFVALDTPNTERLGDGAAVCARAGKSLAIDHHPDTEDSFDISLSSPKTAATGMLVFDVIEALGVKPDSDIANCCYIALVTDTGRFQFQNTDSECFSYASRFVSCGISPSDIAAALYQNRSFSSMQLESRLVSRIAFSDNGVLAYSWVSEADFEELGATKDDAECLPDTIRSLAGVQVALIMRESDGTVRGSMRAKTDFDVGSVARALGGGGHKAAAGFTFKGGIEDCIAAVLPHFE